ncbi:MAG: GGDEF domain-containing protein [Ancylobacter novellus]|uniref:GGDEF domain-containing protein n=1 Tax=Ancylobacter novellus TaxID=921 RepID=A0A2W5MML1_ANCNO|nr:MAG: GGDEF domain-containing protein [Ancylobacter novellus]
MRFGFTFRADSGNGAGARWWRSLAARATLVGGLLLTALSGLLILINAADTRDVAKAVVERAAAAEADRVAAAIGSAPLDEVRFEQTVKAAGFRYVFLLDKGGALIVGRAPSTPLPALSTERVATTGETSFAVMAEQDGVAHGAKSVRLATGGEAVLRFGVSLAPAADAGFASAARGLIAALAFLAVSLPALALLVDRATSPLRALTRAVVRPGAAQAAVRAAGARSDEVGALARAHLSIARDLAENADALHRLTFGDPVTSLPNHASLTSRLAILLQLGRKVALVRVEIDGLSRVAAGLGEDLGDETLRAAARRLREATEAWARGRRQDEPMLARASDHGFELLLEEGDSASAQSLAENVLAAFETPLIVGEHRVATTLAIGAALAPQDGDEAGALIRSASAAVSAARAVGASAVRFAGAELNRLAYGRLRLEQDLRRAIENGEIELHFQPQIALRSGAVSGAEALARWRHPTRGMVPPGEFVSVAEESGLIEALGRFVLAEASRTAADWHGRGIDLRVAVNVSPIQFRRPGFADRTLDIIQSAGADPSQIELEITESAAMGDPQHAARELAPLKAAGLRVAIDDFGTGYSNLSALTRLPFDALKIDREFVRDALEKSGARVVVGTVIGMAKNLGFETIAEGVETEEQLRFVTDHGCTYAQGYLFGRPMPALAFEAWRAERLVTELRAMAVKHRPDGVRSAIAAG